MLTVILVEPEHSSNVGAIARVMANFGYQELVLINPMCDHLDETAVQYAKRATPILKKAIVLKCWKDLSKLKFHSLIGTTALVGSNYNLHRAPLTPSQLSKMLSMKSSCGIVFGREGHGLFNEEIIACDVICTIPASKEYGTLNLSHSVAVVLSTIFAEKQMEHTTSHVAFASVADKLRVLSLLKETLTRMPFASQERRETQVLVWKRLLAKAALTKRETLVLLGFLRKVR